MSWLSDFTSKAENLLTKFDQTAAQTLNESGIQKTLQQESTPQQPPQTTASSYGRESPVTTASAKEYQNASHLFGGGQSERKSQPTNPGIDFRISNTRLTSLRFLNLNCFSRVLILF